MERSDRTNPETANVSQERSFSEIESLFLECLELPPTDRLEFLRRRCRDDLALQEEILDLLEREDAEIKSLPRLIAPAHASAIAAAAPPQIGPYALLRRIGEGGFGEVFEAEQHAPVRRRVALKILKEGMDSRAVLTRFEAERQTLALMDHPGIAKVHDAGMTENGRPYFVMELVSGESITKYVDDAGLGLRDRLTLFAAVCRAVEHAHQKGVIHRDIKPSNILVSGDDGVHRPRIIDFGIAKATGAAISEETLHTRIGDVLGTPEYMSPEQAGSGGVDVDTRTDIYSLGVLLYRLLTGRLPLDPGRLRSAGFDEIQRILREDEPLLPSQAARTQARQTDRRRSSRHDRATVTLNASALPQSSEPSATCIDAKDLRGDLDWIVLKAIEKDRERRYASAAALADDVERHLRDLPVSAAAPSRMYKLRKFIRRHRPLVAMTGIIVLAFLVGLATTMSLAAGASAVILVLVAGLAATMMQAARARRAEAEARQQADAARAVNAFVTRMLVGANPELTPGGSQATLRELVDRAAQDLEDKSTLPPRVEAGIRHTLGTTYFGLGAYEAADRHFGRAVELRSRVLGASDPETLESRLASAEVLMRHGQYAVAESRLAKIGEEIDAHPSIPSELRSRYLRLRGGNLCNLDRFEEAESLLQEVVEMHRHGVNRAELANSLMELSRVVQQRGRYDDAAEGACEALSLMRNAHPGDHAQVASALARLASIHGAKQELAQAEQLHRETVTMYQRLLGPDHASTALALGNLGITLCDAGKWDEAIACQREAVAILSRSLGEDAPETASAVDSLAVSLQSAGILEEALSLRLSSLEVVRRTLGERHLRMATTLNNLGALYRLMQRSEEALDVFEQAHSIYREVYGDDHLMVAIVQNNLGMAKLDLDRFGEAEGHFMHGLALAQNVLPARHSTIGLLRGNLGRALGALDRNDAAEVEFLAAYETVSAGLGATHPRTRTLARDIASFYDKQARTAESETWRQRADHSQITSDTSAGTT